MREAIEKQFAGLQVSQAKIVFKPVEEVQHEAKKRFEIMLTDLERKALPIRAKDENTSGRQFVTDALRVALTHEPVTVERIEELKKVIDVHVQKAGDSIRANIERWNL